MYPARIQVARINQADFEKIAYQWLIQGDYAPIDITENIIGKSNIYYIPVYYFKKIYSGHCRASIGYPRSEEYRVWNDNTKREETRYRMATDWHPHSQPTSGRVHLIGIARDIEKGGVVELINKQINQIDFNGGDSISFNDTFFQHREVADFQYTSQEVWENSIKDIAFNIAYQKAADELPGANKKIHALNIEFHDVDPTNGIYMPYWIFQYYYKDKEYFVFLDANAGQTIGGTKPTDKTLKGRIILINLFYWLGWPFASLGLVYISNWIYSQIKGYESVHTNLFSPLIFLAAMIIMFIFKRKLIKSIKAKSKLARELLLTKKFKSNTGSNDNLAIN